MIENLHNRRVLVVEDEYYLAVETERELRDAGATVIGPVPSVETALDVIAQADVIDAAVLDMNLNGDSIAPVADALAGRNVPFVFATGHGGEDVPARYADILRLEKPIPLSQVQKAIRRLLS